MSPPAEAGTAVGPSTALDRASIVRFVQIPTREAGRIGVVALQLALVLLVIRQFQLESRTFFHVMLLVAVGFVVHALLPLPWRLPFFAALSLASVVVTFGMWDGFFLITLGMALIVICHLPIRMSSRVALLIATGVLFAAWRVEWLPAPWSVAIWPILGSMFMFRLALYLYALKHDERKPTPARTLAYFFMMPNVCFPLYPVVDYSTFSRTHYDRDAHHIYDTGVRWIVRGLLHLILYRFVYLYLAKDPERVMTLGQLVEFILATFLLYLRVSGQFHLITGVLHLFGFRLPETHHLYYLASSFTDFWRRINIYWKDFMTKLVYYPSFFWLRRRGTKAAVVGATIVVFLGTWILHSYQWFWLRGGFPVEAQDGLFWGMLAVLVILGSLRELKRPQKRTLGRGPVWSLSLAVRTLGVFTIICILWSLWTAESVGNWLVLWGVVTRIGPSDLWLITGLVGAGLLIAGHPWSVREPEPRAGMPFYRRSAVHTTALLAIILLLGTTDLYARVSPAASTLIASLQRSTLSARDAALQHKGYYEKLDNTSRMSMQLWELQAKKPPHWKGLGYTDAYRPRTDFVRGDLRPNSSIMFLDQPLTTNRWGMRNRDVTQAKPPGTYRIAFFGPSVIMGSGVADGETLTAVLEDRLNATLGDGRRYEVLNFAVADQSLTEQLVMLQERALLFQPDAVFIADALGFRRPIITQILTAIRRRAPIPYPELEAILAKTGALAYGNPGYPVPFDILRSAFGALGVPTRMPGPEAARRIRGAVDDIARWTFRTIADVARANGAVPVFVFHVVVTDRDSTEPLLRDAADAGFIVFDIVDMWRHRDHSALRIAAADNHPNAAGIRLMADRLTELIREHRRPLGLEAAAIR